jgi:hypothetical protein
MPVQMMSNARLQEVTSLPLERIPDITVQATAATVVRPPTYGEKRASRQAMRGVYFSIAEPIALLK